MALLNDPTSSPMSVFDFSSFLDLDQKNAVSFLKLQHHASSMYPPQEVPPLDSITLSSSCDSGSLLNRSIFAKYWESTKDPPMVLTRRNHAPQEESPTTRSVSTREHEYVEEHPNAGPLVQQPETLPKSPERRSIFGNQHQCSLSDSTRSLPNMHLLPKASPMFGQKKARSSSALMDRPPSILRGGQQKGVREQRRRSSSVSFDEKIDVHIFESPQESWSADGWSKFFNF